MLSAAHDGVKVNEQLSLRYVLYRWRKEMKSSWQECCDTPLDVIMADLEYLSIERQVEAAKARQQNANPKR